MPEAFGELDVSPCEPDYFKDCDIVFSGLDSSVAGEIGDSRTPRHFGKPRA